MEERMTEKRADELQKDGKLVLYMPNKELVQSIIIWCSVMTAGLAVWLIAQPPTKWTDYAMLLFYGFIAYGGIIFIVKDMPSTYYILDENGIIAKEGKKYRTCRWRDFKFVGGVFINKQSYTVCSVIPLLSEKAAKGPNRSISIDAYRHIKTYKNVVIPNDYLYRAGKNTPDVIALWEANHNKEPE